MQRIALVLILALLASLGFAAAQKAKSRSASTSPAKKSTSKSSSKKKAFPTSRKKPSSASSSKTASKKTASAKKSPPKKPAASTRYSRSRRRRTPRVSTQQEPAPERYQQIQKALADRGYLDGAPSGKWDPSSAEAMRRFQEDQHLEASGKIDALSLIALGLGPRRVSENQVRPPNDDRSPEGSQRP